MISEDRWSEWGDLNSQHPAPKAGALPVALHPVIHFSVFAVVVKHVVKGPCSRKLRGRGSAETPVITRGCGFPDFSVAPGVLHAPKPPALPTGLHPDREMRRPVRTTHLLYQFLMRITRGELRAGPVVFRQALTCPKRPSARQRGRSAPSERPDPRGPCGRKRPAGDRWDGADPDPG